MTQTTRPKHGFDNGERVEHPIFGEVVVAQEGDDEPDRDDLVPIEGGTIRSGRLLVPANHLTSLEDE